MEYGWSGQNQQETGEPRVWSAHASHGTALPSSELQLALVRGAGELRDVERRIQRIKASTERVLATSRGFVPAYSPLAAEIAAAAEEAEEAQRQIGSARAFLENSAGPVIGTGVFTGMGSFGRLAGSVATSRSGGSLNEIIRQPSVEVRDNGKEFIVRAELPGMSKEDIEIQATEGLLYVLAEQEDETIEVGQLVSAECLARQFERTVSLPEHVVPSKAVAAFRDGILEVTLPKKHPGEPAQRLTLK